MPDTDDDRKEGRRVSLLCGKDKAVVPVSGSPSPYWVDTVRAVREDWSSLVINIRQ
jgi:hypothetical protein